MAMLNNQRAIANGPTEWGTLGASTIHCTCYYMFIMFEYVWAIPIQETNVEPTIENQQESNQRNLMFLANQRLAWGNVKVTDQKEPNIMDVWRPRMVRNSVALLRYPEDCATAKTQPIHLSFTKGIPCLDLCGKKVPQNSRDEHHLSSTMEIYCNTATYFRINPSFGQTHPHHILLDGSDYFQFVPIICIHQIASHDIPWYPHKFRLGLHSPQQGTCLWLRR